MPSVISKFLLSRLPGPYNSSKLYLQGKLTEVCSNFHIYWETAIIKWGLLVLPIIRQKERQSENNRAQSSRLNTWQSGDCWSFTETTSDSSVVFLTTAGAGSLFRDGKDRDVVGCSFKIISCGIHETRAVRRGVRNWLQFTLKRAAASRRSFFLTLPLLFSSYWKNQPCLFIPPS